MSTSIPQIEGQCFVCRNNITTDNVGFLLSLFLLYKLKYLVQMNPRMETSFLAHIL